MKTFIRFRNAISRFAGWLYDHRKTVQKYVAVMLALAVLNLSVGCMNYFRVNSSATPTSGTISGLKAMQKTIIVHFNDEKWILQNAEVKGDTLTGKLAEYKNLPTWKPVNPDRPNRYFKRASRNESYLLNEVHLYPAEYSNAGNNMISIPITAIEKLEIYEKDIATTVGSWTLGFLAGAAGAFSIFIILLAIFKESCPFIYTWDGDSYQFAGEIYSGSIYRNLERHDYLRLPTYSGQNSYSLKITNEAYEIQRTNLMELLVVDHPEKTEIFVDKNGRIMTLQNLLPPVTATSLTNRDVTQLVTAKDKSVYQTGSSTGNYELKDGLIMEFPSSENAKTAKLAIHAKNSVMLDFMLGKFHDMFGSAYHYIMKMQGEAPAGELRQWTLDQGIPLSLYVERDHTWEFVDYYNVAGPMAFKDDVLEIPLKGNESNPLKVKLEFGSFFWEIDYVAIDYSPDAFVTTYTLPVKTALNERNRDVSGLLMHDDGKYYTQPLTDNQAVVTFDLPAVSNLSRTVYLHSKGWYELIRNPKGPHDKEYLLTFKQPGRFNQFVIDEMKKMEETASQSR